MKKIIFIAATVLIVAASITLARPPMNLELSYDLDAKILHVELDHIVEDRNEDYIRKLVIQKNDEDLINKYYRSQSNARKFIKDLPLEAEEGDTIWVKAYASEGGSTAATLTVIKEPKDAESADQDRPENAEDVPSPTSETPRDRY